MQEALQSGLSLGDDELDQIEAETDKEAAAPVEEEMEEETQAEEEEESEAWSLARSSKLSVLLSLLLSLRRDGHKTLLFSMSAKFLDRVAQLLKAHPECTWTRLDGSVADLRERARIVAAYSETSVDEQFVRTPPSSLLSSLRPIMIYQTPI